MCICLLCVHKQRRCREASLLRHTIDGIGVGLKGCCGVVLVCYHATRALRERLGHIETADHHHLYFSNTNTLELVHTTIPSGASPRLYIHQVARLAVWADCL